MKIPTIKRFLIPIQLLILSIIFTTTINAQQQPESTTANTIVVVSRITGLVQDYNQVDRSIYYGVSCLGPCTISRSVSTSWSNGWSATISIKVNEVTAQTGVQVTRTGTDTSTVTFNVPNGQRKGIWYYHTYNVKKWSAVEETLSCNEFTCVSIGKKDGFVTTKDRINTTYYLDWAR